MSSHSSLVFKLEALAFEEAGETARPGKVWTEVLGSAGAALIAEGAGTGAAATVFIAVAGASVDAVVSEGSTAGRIQLTLARS